MKIAVTGSEGHLGRWLVNKYGLIPLKCDITKQEEVKEVINSVSPDVIIHAAAHTDIKYCEENITEAINVNMRGTSNIIDWFPNGVLIYLSTSHVFSGLFNVTYKETSKIKPLNNYGWTKWGGEALCSLATCQTIIVRISKLFDLEYLAPDLLKLENGDTITHPTFIRRTFVYMPHFIEGLLKLIDLHETAPNIINISGTKNLSFKEFWSQIATEFGKNNLVAARSVDNKSTHRPYNGGLDTSLAKRIGIPLYSALDGIKEIKKLL